MLSSESVLLSGKAALGNVHLMSVRKNTLVDLS